MKKTLLTLLILCLCTVILCACDFSERPSDRQPEIGPESVMTLPDDTDNTSEITTEDTSITEDTSTTDSTTTAPVSYEKGWTERF